jgi:predicted N-formylglutamate amidohydrolase
MARAAGMDDPVFTMENRDGASNILLVCEHASNHFPKLSARLG